MLREPYVGRGKLDVLPKVMARAPGTIAVHASKLRALVAERHVFVAARTPGY